MKRCSRVLLAGLGMSACFPTGNGGDPCDDDRYGCANGELDVEPSCELAGELLVSVGAGEGSFEPLAEGESPPIFTGPQGGQHTMLGVRVDNAALDRYDELQVRFGIFPASQCPALEDDDLLATCSGDPEGGERMVVLGEALPLAVADDGAVEEHDIVVFIDFFGEPEMVIEAIVDDPCGRRGLARHRMRPDG